MNKHPRPYLSEKILIYINYILPKLGYKFSYTKMQNTFTDFYKVTYSLKTLRKEFSNLRRAGLITHATRYRKPYPILTRNGKLQISSRLPYKKFEKWDRYWRLVLFNLPERERQYRTILRKNLSDLGFQRIQKGVYISPHDFLPTIRRIANELGIRQYLTIIESDKIDREKFAIQKIWNLDDINQEYKGFIKQVDNKKFIKKTRVDKNNLYWPLKAKQLEQQFYEIYKKDPHLPIELLPSSWLGDEAYNKYKELTLSY